MKLYTPLNKALQPSFLSRVDPIPLRNDLMHLSNRLSWEGPNSFDSRVSWKVSCWSSDRKLVWTERLNIPRRRDIADHIYLLNFCIIESINKIDIFCIHIISYTNVKMLVSFRYFSHRQILKYEELISVIQY